VSRQPRQRCRDWRAVISPGRWQGHRRRSWRILSVTVQG
ncbi:hypothetical protein AZ009_000564, partial [Klebsiella pneumoniae]